MWDGSSGLPGTLFQMPLRTPAQAETSQLSTRAYTQEKVLDMLIAFGGAANEMVLFLQSVESIEVYLKVPLHPAPSSAPRSFLPCMMLL